MTTAKAVPDKPISDAKEVAPVAPAGEEREALEEAGVDVPSVKKRATRSTKD